jgi:hypothetical protein
MRVTALKGLGMMFSLVLLAVMHPVSAHACAACYGDPDSPASKGLSWAIFALVGAVMSVLAGVVAFFVHASRQAARLDHTETEEVLVPQS